MATKKVLNSVLAVSIFIFAFSCGGKTGKQEYSTEEDQVAVEKEEYLPKADSFYEDSNDWIVGDWYDEDGWSITFQEDGSFYFGDDCTTNGTFTIKDNAVHLKGKTKCEGEGKAENYNDTFILEGNSIKGFEKATVIYTPPQPSEKLNGMVVVINGVKWATRNVNTPGTFVDNPEDSGMLYQWNRKVAWIGAGYYTVDDWDGSMPTGRIWEKSNDPSPVGWRVPTLAEMKKLFDHHNVIREIITVNGIKCGKFTDKTNGKSIFLPVTGYRHYANGALNEYRARGHYWSNTHDSRPHAVYSFDLVIGNGVDDGNPVIVYLTSDYKSYARAIRPVAN